MVLRKTMLLAQETPMMVLIISGRRPHRPYIGAPRIDPLVSVVNSHQRNPKHLTHLNPKAIRASVTSPPEIAPKAKLGTQTRRLLQSAAGFYNLEFVCWGAYSAL